MSSQSDQVPSSRPARNAAPERRRLLHRRDLDPAPRRVGHRLREDRVGAHPTIDAQRVDGHAGVGDGRLDEVGAAPGHALEHGPHHLGAGRAHG